MPFLTSHECNIPKVMKFACPVLSFTPSLVYGLSANESAKIADERLGWGSL
jgi:hypothetical protein